MPSANVDPAEQNLDAGDAAYEDGKSITLDAGDNEVEGGNPVNFDAEGYIDVAGEGEDPLGIVLGQSDEKADNMWTVHVDRLPVVHHVPGGADNGDHLEPDDGGAYQVVDGAEEEPHQPVVVNTAVEADDLYVALI